MNVSDIMVTDVISISPEDIVARAISLMIENSVHQLPVIENNEYKGMVYVKHFIEANVFPKTTKARHFVVKTPSLSPNTEIWQANQAIIKSGLRALPVINKNKLVGVVSETDLVQVTDIGNALVDDVMNGAVVVEEDSPLSYALSNMKKQNISRQPVINKNGKLVGSMNNLDIAGVLRLPKERKSASKTTRISAGADKTDARSVQVKVLMGRASAVKRGTKLSEGVKFLKTTEEIIVTDDDMPVGIITPKDVIKFSMPDRRGPVIQIAHVEDEATKQEIANELTKFLKRVSSRFDRIYSLEIAVDRHRTRKYSMRGRLMTTEGLISAKSVGWDVRSASKELVTRFDRRIESYKPDRHRESLKLS